jgi:broad specificity phosphatase PhoE
MNEVNSPSADELHVIFIRHGRTTDNAKGVISGGAADPDLVPEGRDQAKEANKVYKALKTKGLVNDDTPLFTTDRTRAVDTAKYFTGRENGENIKTDQRLLERLLGDWDSKLTERLQKEVKAIDGFSPPNEEKPADHKAHVVESLDQHIKESDGKPFMIVSHGGTTRRIAAYFGIEEGLEVQNAVPHHAMSRDGGKTWEVKKFRVDEKGELQEEVLPKKLPKAANTNRTMESILEEHAAKASLSNDALTIETDINQGAKDALADDLGQLLIGKHYKDGGVITVEGANVVVKLDKVQSEILQEFAKLKGMAIPAQ